MSDFNALKFVADNAGLNIFKALEKAYEQGKKDALRWIPVSEKMPEEKINPNTSDFEKVICSTTFGDVRAYKCGTPYGWEKPHFWRGLNVMDEYVLAWMPMPEPWKGETDGKVD